MKRAASLLLIAVLLASAAGSLSAQEGHVSFTWAFVKQASDGSPASLDFSERVAVVKGDLFKILLQPAAATYVYLFLQDSAGEVQMLFPDAFGDFTASSYGTARFVIPTGDDWFTLDGVRGTERFHLLASATRLTSLETQVIAWQKVAANAKSSVAQRNAARQAVLDEIARIRKDHSQLAVAAEKPVTIAGGTRGIVQEMEKKAVKIDATGFYTKTLRLEH